MTEAQTHEEVVEGSETVNSNSTTTDALEGNELEAESFLIRVELYKAMRSFLSVSPNYTNNGDGKESGQTSQEKNSKKKKTDAVEKMLSEIKRIDNGLLLDTNDHFPKKDVSSKSYLVIDKHTWRNYNRIHRIKPIPLGNYLVVKSDGSVSSHVEVFPLILVFHYDNEIRKVRMWRRTEIQTVKETALNLFGITQKCVPFTFDESLATFAMCSETSGTKPDEKCHLYLRLTNKDLFIHHREKELKEYSLFTANEGKNVMRLKVPKEWFVNWISFVENSSEKISTDCIPGPIPVNTISESSEDVVTIPENFYFLLNKWYSVEGGHIYVQPKKNVLFRAISSFFRGNAPVRGAVGLSNCGNSCYLGSSVQCLSATVELRSLFLSLEWQKHYNPKNPLGHKGEFAVAFDKLIRNLWSTDNSSISPKEFKSVIGLHCEQFNNSHQQDAHEFIISLIDGLHEDLNCAKPQKYIEIDDYDKKKETIAEHAFKWETNFTNRNKGPIYDLFYGITQISVVCSNCANLSISYENVNVLTLELPVVLQILICQNEGTYYHAMHCRSDDTFGDVKRRIAEQFRSHFEMFAYDGEIYKYYYLNDQNTIAQTESLDILAMQTKYKVVRPTTIEVKEKNDEKKDEKVNVSEKSNSPKQTKIEIQEVKDEGKNKDKEEKQKVEDEEKHKDEEENLIDEVKEEKKKIEVKEEKHKVKGEGKHKVKEEGKLKDKEEKLKVENQKAEEEENGRHDKQNKQEKHEKHEKNDKHENHENQEKHEEKQEEKQEKDKTANSLTRSTTSPKLLKENERKVELVQDIEAFTCTSTQLYFVRQMQGSKLFGVPSVLVVPKSLILSGYELLSLVFESTAHLFVKSKCKVVRKLLKKRTDLFETLPFELFWIQKNKLKPIDNFEEIIDLFILKNRIIVIRWKEQFAKEWLLPISQITPKRLPSDGSTINIPSRSSCDLHSCLQSTWSKSELALNSEHKCSKCGKESRSNVQTRIWKPQRIVVFHLKRFCTDSHGRFRKNHTNVTFPQTIDLKEYIVGPKQQNTVYKLYGVISHFGVLGQGHYISTAFHNEAQKWYEFNDSSVSESSTNGLEKSAYLLFYHLQL